MSAMLRLDKRRLRNHPTTTASKAKMLSHQNDQTPNQRTSRTTPQSLLTSAIGRSPMPATINPNVQGKGFQLVSHALLRQLQCSTPGPAFPSEMYHPAHISDSSRDKIDLLEVLQNGRFGTCIYALTTNARTSKRRVPVDSDNLGGELAKKGKVTSSQVRVRPQKQSKWLPDDIYDASVYVCELMDHLGYSEAMVRHRRDIHKEFDMKTSGFFADLTVITTGSKAEGFSVPFESDMDKMYIRKDIMCTLPRDASRNLSDSHSEFTMYRDHCHAGHYILDLRNMCYRVGSVFPAASFVQRNGRRYLSSEKYVNELLKYSHFSTISGPAVTYFDGFHSFDTVQALLCSSQEQLLSEWIKRPRLRNWLSPELIQEITKLPAYLVPVGCKNSEQKHMEWRLCFSGEHKLTCSFTESQYKLYILLKFINKHELKPICKTLSSYMMKNIVLWFVESNSQESFFRNNLIINLISCFKKLQLAIKNSYIPYYMIPDRNLLIGRICPNEQKQLIIKLDQLIQEGPRVVLRCPKIREAQQMSAAELAEKGRWRDKLEKLFLEREVIGLTYLKPDVETKELMEHVHRDPHFISVMESIWDMVMPLWRLFELEGISDILNMKMVQALS